MHAEPRRPRRGKTLDGSAPTGSSMIRRSCRGSGRGSWRLLVPEREKSSSRTGADTDGPTRRLREQLTSFSLTTAPDAKWWRPGRLFKTILVHPPSAPTTSVSLPSAISRSRPSRRTGRPMSTAPECGSKRSDASASSDASGRTVDIEAGRPHPRHRCRTAARSTLKPDGRVPAPPREPIRVN